MSIVSIYFVIEVTHPRPSNRTIVADKAGSIKGLEASFLLTLVFGRPRQ